MKKFVSCLVLFISPWVLFLSKADTFTVTATTDSGPGSLRQAILNANGVFGKTNNILFNIPGPGVHTIVPLTPLPSISVSAVIDGYSQPGSRPNSLAEGDDAVLLIELRGTLSITAGNSLVRGLVINSASVGLDIEGSAGNVVEGNFIGTDATGTVNLGNENEGIFLSTFDLKARGNRIGGATPAARNLISGNHFAGISARNSSETNLIQGNLIGTDITGRRPLGNSLYGIRVFATNPNAAGGSVIGGKNPGEGNVLAFNGTGVWVLQGSHHSILGNSLFGNEGLPIAVGMSSDSQSSPAGPTANDAGDGDSGPNGHQNYPVLTSVNVSGGNTTVRGTLNSQPNSGYHLEFFADQEPSTSFYGEGRTFLGAREVTTDAAGNADFTVTFAVAAPFVSATATDAAGSTSELSLNLLPAPDAFATGDLIIGTGDGVVQWRRSDGSPVRLLDTGFGTGIRPAGMAFDRGTNLYVTGQNSNVIARFDPQGRRLGNFAGGDNGFSAGIVFDATGNAYVSAFGGSFDVRKFSPSGTLLDQFALDERISGVEWFELASDQRTLFFTSFVSGLLGTRYLPLIERFDLSTRQRLTDFFTAGADESVYTIRLLPDGGVLAVTDREIRRVNASGQVSQTYDVPGEDAWGTLALDSDGLSFWAGSYAGPNIYQFDIGSGALRARLSARVPNGISQLAVRGEPSAGNAGLFLGLSAQPAVVAVNGQVTYTLALLNFRTNDATGVKVVDTLPASARFASASISQGTFVQTGSTVTFTLGTLLRGATATMTVTVAPSSAGTVLNSATVSANEGDPSPENNSASVSTRAVAAPACSLVVVNVNDSGPGSLRAVIECANAAPGLDTITFNIPGPGPHVLRPSSALPVITDSVVIDGYSQPGAAPNSAVIGDNAVLQIELDGSQAGPLADGLMISAPQCAVRGLAIHSFNGNGIRLTGLGGTVVEGNFVGSDVTGQLRRPNARNGVLITDSFSNTIGGSAPEKRNLIAANAGAGVAITGAQAGHNRVEGNLIGIARDGSSALGNGGDGVLVSSPDNSIGGAGASANGIAFNAHAGVEVFGSTERNRFSLSKFLDVSGVAIEGNSIYANTGLGIDLAPPGVTLNDAAGDEGSDSDFGPNRLQNFPVLSPIVPGSPQISGVLQSLPGTAFRIEFFSNPECHSSGFGPGQTFIGSTTATTDANGLANFTANIASGLEEGKFITAVAIAPWGDTSEFSQCVRVSPAADLSLALIASADPQLAKSNLTYTLQVRNNGPGPASGFLLTNLVPRFVTFVSASAGCSLSNGVVYCPLATLAAGATFTATVVVRPDRVGAITTEAGVTAVELEPSPANNHVSLTTQITSPPRTLVVTTTNDAEAGSLRAAIEEANSHGAGADTIAFNIAGAGVRTIKLASSLPSVRVPVVIDGYTQPGAKANTLADGDNATLLIELTAAKPANQSGAIAHGLVLNAGNSTVRGLVINNFSQRAIYVTPFGSTDQPAEDGTVIEGNFIGTDATGKTARPNGDFGIELDGSGTARIGGSAPAARNIISGNGGFRSGFAGAALAVRADGRVEIQGNFIGVDASGRAPLGNHGRGIEIRSPDFPTLVGGTEAGTANIIAFNGGGVGAGFGAGVSILGNSIFNSERLGIDLGLMDEPVLNDPGDTDDGFQNFPVLTSVASAGGTTTVQGLLNSHSNATYRLEFFSNTKPNLSGFGEGERFLGFTAVTTDGNGNASFTATFPGDATFVTATATDAGGNTSEFSMPLLPPPGAFQPGDLFLGAVGGIIQWRRSDGLLIKYLNANQRFSAEGMAFDRLGNLFAAFPFNDDVVEMFDHRGDLVGTAILDPVSRPQPIVFDAAGNFYIGSLGSGGKVQKYGPNGRLLVAYSMAADFGGIEYMDLAGDQHTLFYTVGRDVKRFDVAGNAQLPDLVTNLPGTDLRGIRLLPAGGLLVAESEQILRLDDKGRVIQTYDADNQSSWETLSLDPDGGSFWASSQSSTFVYKFDLGTGTNLMRLPAFSQSAIGSLAVYGEPRVAMPAAPALDVSLENEQVVISWPASPAGFELKSSDTLGSPGNWTKTVPGPTLVNGRNVVALTPGKGTQFFRLEKNP